LADIEAALQPLAAWMNQKSWIPHHEMSYVWWTYFESSNWVRLPFEGGIADQPLWVWDDFARYNDIAEFENLYYEKDRLIKRQLKNLKGHLP
jgi:hypothetical protein